jgi:hypothetical protein
MAGALFSAQWKFRGREERNGDQAKPFAIEHDARASERSTILHESRPKGTLVHRKPSG